MYLEIMKINIKKKKMLRKNQNRKNELKGIKGYKVEFEGRVNIGKKL